MRCLFATDYPHWHFDDNEALPSGLSEVVLRKILCGNAQATYPRLAEANSAMEVNA